MFSSLRSPWSNSYDPPLDDGTMPSESLRKLEIEANNAFDQYREMYFEGGVSSVYLWDLKQGFAGVILIKKAGDGSKVIKGCWDSIHVIEVQVSCFVDQISCSSCHNIHFSSLTIIDLGRADSPVVTVLAHKVNGLSLIL